MGAEGQLAKLLADPAASASDIEKLNLGIEKMKADLQALNLEYEGLAASNSAASLIPTTFTQGLNQAIEAYRILNATGRSTSQIIISELGGAVDTVAGGIQTFFTDILTGAQSAGQAFASFGKTILRTIEQIVAKIIATKLIELLFNVIGGAIGGSVGGTGRSSSASTTTTARSIGHFNGGPVRTGFIGGGLVTSGYPGRDSVDARLAKGEYVLRGAAVRSLGPQFVRELNERGSRALGGLSRTPSINTKPALQTTSVYVVSPEHKEPMGPNDILVVIQDDILKGGVSVTYRAASACSKR